MAVNKNFIIRNGLEVDESLIFADADTQKVGIGTTTPECELTVAGKLCADTAEFTGIVTASGFFQGAVSGTDIIADNLNVSGISTLNNVEINGLLTAGGTTGQANYYLSNTGTGVTWKSFQESVIDSVTFTASEGQSLFTVDYEIGLIEVYLNGVRLTDSEFSALTGSTVTLIDPAFEGDTVDFVRYSNAFDFFQLGDINIDTTGIISATSFYGDGSNLTGVVASSTAKVEVVDSDAATDHYLTFVDSNNDPTKDDEIVYSDVDLTYKPSTSTLFVGGRIGISTPTASQKLDVNGNARFRGAIYDNNNLDGDADDVLVSTGAGVTWKDLSSIINDSNLNTTGIVTAGLFDGPLTTTGIVTAGLFDGPLTTTGIVTASSFVGDGSGLTGIVTSITAGSGIGIDTTTGNVTISATGISDDDWTISAAGVHTTASVGIGTTPGQFYNPLGSPGDTALNVYGGGFNFSDSDGKTILRYEDGPSSSTRGITLNIFGDKDGGAASNSKYVHTWKSRWMFGNEYTNANRCQTSLVPPVTGTSEARVGFYTPEAFEGRGAVMIMCNDVQEALDPGRGPNLNFVGSRGLNGEADYDTTYQDDVLGRISFQGCVGSTQHMGAAIQVQQDNVGSATTDTGVSGRLQFFTTPEIVGFNTGEGRQTVPVERMTIKGDGNIGIGTDNPSGPADPNNTTILNAGIVTANNFYGDGSGLTNIGGGGVLGPYAILQDRKPQGVDGGGTYDYEVIRDLNTVVYDPSNIVSLSIATSQFTLNAGTYLIEWSAPSRRGGENRTILYDVTGIVSHYGTSEYASNGSSQASQTRAFGIASTTISSPHIFEIRHGFVSAASTFTEKLGRATGIGGSEIYTTVKIHKEI